MRLLSQRVACMLLEMALVDIDERLMRERDKGFEVVGERSREIVTTFGELRKAPGTTRERVCELRRCILENWDGIKSLPEDKRLGTIEGQVRHTMPALSGPHASQPWVKYIVRTLTSIRAETLTA